MFGSLVRGAVLNARRSLDDISRSVADRRSVQHEDSHAHDLVRLPEAECLALLEECTIGRLAYLSRPGEPDVVPVNFLWYDGSVWIRTAPGPKMQAAERRERVAFEVDRIDETTRTGSSVVVVGRLQVAGPGQLPPGIGPDPWSHGTRRHVLRLVPQRVEGRIVLG